MEAIKSIGFGEIIIDWEDGKKEIIPFKNRVLYGGRTALAATLANNFGSSFEYFVTGMTFGSGGTLNGVPRYIDDTRAGLFGPVIITKPIISSIDPSIPTKATFTSVLVFNEAVGSVVNEMALKFNSGNYFSMATFGDINKTSSMQLTFNWNINMV